MTGSLSNQQIDVAPAKAFRHRALLITGVVQALVFLAIPVSGLFGRGLPTAQVICLSLGTLIASGATLATWRGLPQAPCALVLCVGSVLFTSCFGLHRRLTSPSARLLRGSCG